MVDDQRGRPASDRLWISTFRAKKETNVTVETGYSGPGVGGSMMDTIRAATVARANACRSLPVAARSPEQAARIRARLQAAQQSRRERDEHAATGSDQTPPRKRPPARILTDEEREAAAQRREERRRARQQAEEELRSNPDFEEMRRAAAEIALKRRYGPIPAKSWPLACNSDHFVCKK